MTNQANTPSLYRLTAYDLATEQEVILFTSKSIDRLVTRLTLLGDEASRYDDITLEDNSLGFYTPTLLEAITGSWKRGEISGMDYTMATAYCS